MASRRSENVYNHLFGIIALVANVKIAYAIQNFPELLQRVARGETVVISRYNTPVAQLIPPPAEEQPQPKFGTGKGKAWLIDPSVLDPMTDAEADDFLEGQ
jgi:antitoxin (DNA-binding transcriptional repressor) of toxin-antitoxin stability system